MPVVRWRPKPRPFLLSLLVVLIALAATTPAHAQARAARPQLATPYILSQQDKGDVRRAEKYLNEITTLQSRFLQVTSLGRFAEGTIYMSRPGRMRVQYDEPNPVLIVANNDTITYVDPEYDQASYYPLNETPAGILLKERIQLLSDDFIIRGVEREASTLRIVLARAEDSLQGQVTLVFSTRPFQLKKWEIIDAQGLLTAVALQQPRFGGRLAADLFRYDETRGAGPGN